MAYAASALAASATAIAWAPPAISMRLRLLSTLLLAGVALTHIGLHAGRLADPAAWAVDLGILAAAALLALSVHLSRRAS